VGREKLEIEMKRLQTAIWSQTFATDFTPFAIATFIADADRSIFINLLAEPNGDFYNVLANFKIFVTVTRSPFNESLLDGYTAQSGIYDFNYYFDSYNHYLNSGGVTGPAWTQPFRNLLVTAGDVVTVYLSPANVATGLTADGFVEFYGTETAEEIASAVLDGIVEGGLTLKKLLRLCLAVLANKASGGGTGTVKFRDVSDGMDRVTMTVNEHGNRTEVTLDGEDVEE
jgi:hypothetical protein